MKQVREHVGGGPIEMYLNMIAACIRTVVHSGGEVESVELCSLYVSSVSTVRRRPRPRRVPVQTQNLVTCLSLTQPPPQNKSKAPWFLKLFFAALHARKHDSSYFFTSFLALPVGENGETQPSSTKINLPTALARPPSSAQPECLRICFFHTFGMSLSQICFVRVSCHATCLARLSHHVSCSQKMFCQSVSHLERVCPNSVFHVLPMSCSQKISVSLSCGDPTFDCTPRLLQPVGVGTSTGSGHFPCRPWNSPVTSLMVDE